MGAQHWHAEPDAGELGHWHVVRIQDGARMGTVASGLSAPEAHLIAGAARMLSPGFANRPGYREDHDPSHPLTRALRELVQVHGLSGAVLLTFTPDRVGVNSSSPSAKFGAVMEHLGDLILARFDAGDLDAAIALAEGRS